MVTHSLWSEEYWPMLLQIYFKKPIGIKPTYAHPIVELSLELHIPPYILYAKMEECQQSKKTTKRCQTHKKDERIWQT